MQWTEIIADFHSLKVGLKHGENERSTGSEKKRMKLLRETHDGPREPKFRRLGTITLILFGICKILADCGDMLVIDTCT